MPHLPSTKHYSHDTRAPGRAAAAAAAARAGGRIRTGRSSDRLSGRCSVCQSVPSAVSAHSSSAVRYREAWRRGETRRRWRRRRRQRHARADGFGLGGAATAWAAAALSARACRRVWLLLQCSRKVLAGAESGAGISNQPPAGAAESPRYNIVPRTRSKNPSTKRLSESAA